MLTPLNDARRVRILTDALAVKTRPSGDSQFVTLQRFADDFCKADRLIESAIFSRAWLRALACDVLASTILNAR